MAKKYEISTVFKGVDKMSAPLSKMRNKLKKFGASASRTFKKMGKAAKSIGKGMLKGIGVGVAVAVGSLLLLKRTLDGVADSADKLAKTARRLAFPVEELQEWRFVGEQSGLTNQEMDKSLEKYAKTVGEAKMGIGTLATTLKSSNPQLLKQLQNADNTSDALELYLNMLREVKDPMEQMALATAAFGKSGGKMINVVHNSKDAIKGLRQEMRENGVMTKAQVEEAERYNDVMNSMEKAIKGLVNDGLSPMLTIFADLAVEGRAWILANKELINSKVSEFYEGLKSVMRYIRDNWEAIKKWGTYIGVAVVAIGVLVAAIITIGGAITAVTAAIPALIIGLKIALVGAALWAVGKIYEAFDALGGAAIAIFGQITTGIKMQWIELVSYVTGAWDSIKEMAETIGLGGIMKVIGIDPSKGRRVEPERVQTPVSTPSERTAQLIESRVMNSAEVTIRDESGRAEVTQGGNFKGFNFAASGAV